ncbi:HTH-type transcriptional repressor YtrA [Botrimarina colliarenosi]|uniref:HTH-type transcriptional repressor YtrA n=1 Tax=Botrimarina colliarenosi TaxID=2528001 RepID=A0A5C6AND1_9BACT|nr:GntR family transcriptional regulator [Botrimarina colliarenosi]TWU00522.1 HTH-type transcriptional repressor YtrA [Botrimarina colliarenosi]
MSSPRHFDIQPQSGVPIYQQIVDQAGALIAGGRLAPGDLLPSVREVARSAEVNPMTVSKAYSKLEAEGLVERVRGRGMRVRRLTEGEGSVTQRKTQLEALLEPALARAAQLGLSADQVRQVVERLLKGYRP